MISPQFSKTKRIKWGHFTDVFIQELREKTACGKNFFNVHQTEFTQTQVVNHIDINEQGHDTT
jgi:hypothetical protein